MERRPSFTTRSRWWAWGHTKIQRKIKIIEKVDVPAAEVSAAPIPTTQGEPTP